MKLRLLSLLLACLLVFVAIPGVGAQQTVCFNLSPDDCAILQQANSADLKSFNMGFKFNLSLTGLDAFQPGTGEVNMTLDASGPIMLDPAMMTAENPFGGVALMLDGNLAFKGAGEDESLALSLVMKDGNIYFKDPTSEQWMGMSMSEIMTPLMAMSGMAFDPATLMSGDTSGLTGMAGMGDMTEMLSQLEALANIPGFIDYQRLADEDLMGQTTYPFSLTVDFVPLLKSPEFANVIATAMAASGGEEMGGMSGEQLGMMIPMLLGESTATLNFTEWIGKDDLFTHRVTLDIDASIDPTGFMGLAGGTSGSAAATAPTTPIVIDLHVEVDLTDLNATFDIQAPEGATMAPMSN